MRIGIDIGGTNTDGVLMTKKEVLATIKIQNCLSVSDTLMSVVNELCKLAGIQHGQVDTIVLGTTFFINILLEQQKLCKIGLIRVSHTSANTLPPFIDWPHDLTKQVCGRWYHLAGGVEYDGSITSHIDTSQLLKIIEQFKKDNIQSIAISSPFSHLYPIIEKEIQQIIQEKYPKSYLSLSSHLGGLGLLERENAAIINATLQHSAQQLAASIHHAFSKNHLACQIFISRNDGTIISLREMQRYPVVTFASGATNSLRGAAFLSHLKEALVIDVGGTSTDIGMIKKGFPLKTFRPHSVVGVKTSLGFPDIQSFALGGGTVIENIDNNWRIGPESVGSDLYKKAYSFGGDTLTATDIMLYCGRMEIANDVKRNHLTPAQLKQVDGKIQTIFKNLITTIKPCKLNYPLVVVGGAASLVRSDIAGVSHVVQPQHAGVANAVGAALAQVSGDCERIVSYRVSDRCDVIDAMISSATAKAIAIGAEPGTIDVIECEEIPVSYSNDDCYRLKVRVVGNYCNHFNGKENE